MSKQIIEKLTPIIRKQSRYLSGLSPEHTADDLLQHALLSLWERHIEKDDLEEYQDGYWLKFCDWKMRNLASNGRTYSRLQTLPPDFDTGLAPMGYIKPDYADDFDLEHDYINAEKMREVAHCAREFTDNRQQILTLIYLGYSMSEIADKLGVSYNSLFNQRKFMYDHLKLEIVE